MSWWEWTFYGELLLRTSICFVGLILLYNRFRLLSKMGKADSISRSKIPQQFYARVIFLILNSLLTVAVIIIILTLSQYTCLGGEHLLCEYSWSQIAWVIVNIFQIIVLRKEYRRDVEFSLLHRVLWLSDLVCFSLIFGIQLYLWNLYQKNEQEVYLYENLRYFAEGAVRWFIKTCLVIVSLWKAQKTTFKCKVAISDLALPDNLMTEQQKKNMIIYHKNNLNNNHLDANNDQKIHGQFVQTTLFTQPDSEKTQQNTTRAMLGQESDHIIETEQSGKDYLFIEPKKIQIKVKNQLRIDPNSGENIFTMQCNHFPKQGDSFTITRSLKDIMRLQTHLMSLGGYSQLPEEHLDLQVTAFQQILRIQKFFDWALKSCYFESSFLLKFLQLPLDQYLTHVNSFQSNRNGLEDVLQKFRMELPELKKKLNIYLVGDVKVSEQCHPRNINSNKIKNSRSYQFRFIPSSCQLDEQSESTMKISTQFSDTEFMKFLSLYAVSIIPLKLPGNNLNNSNNYSTTRFTKYKTKSNITSLLSSLFNENMYYNKLLFEFFSVDINSITRIADAITEHQTCFVDNIDLRQLKVTLLGNINEFQTNEYVFSLRYLNKPFIYIQKRLKHFQQLKNELDLYALNRKQSVILNQGKIQKVNGKNNDNLPLQENRNNNLAATGQNEYTVESESSEGIAQRLSKAGQDSNWNQPDGIISPEKFEREILRQVKNLIKVPNMPHSISECACFLQESIQQTHLLQSTALRQFLFDFRQIDLEQQVQQKSSQKQQQQQQLFSDDSGFSLEFSKD